MRSIQEDKIPLTGFKLSIKIQNKIFNYQDTSDSININDTKEIVTLWN